MRRELDDDRLEAADEASCFMRGIAAGDVLMCRNMCGQVETAVQGPNAGFFPSASKAGASRAEALGHAVARN